MSGVCLELPGGLEPEPPGGLEPGLGVEQDTHLPSMLLLETMHTSHSHDPTAGANLAASPDGVMSALGAEHAAHTLSLALLGTIHFSHSHEPVGGANFAPREVELVGVTNFAPRVVELVGGTDVFAPREAVLVIRLHSGDEGTADGLELRQATHLSESGLLLIQHTPQVQEPAGGAN